VVRREIAAHVCRTYVQTNDPAVFASRLDYHTTHRLKRMRQSLELRRSLPLVNCTARGNPNWCASSRSGRHFGLMVLRLA
jgi:hypothetical protein